MHVRPTVAPDTSNIDERAQLAVKAFRNMQHGLTNYARAITGNKKVRVEIGAGAPMTEGQVIYYRPPIALGDKTPHDRFLCDERGEDGLKACPACRIREEVLVNIYHEIAHIAFGSFAGGVNYMELASRYNPYLLHIFNSLEDSRVDSSMFEARKGTRKMFAADVYNLLRNGVEQVDGDMVQYRDAPLNSQMTIACYFEAAGYVDWHEYLHPQVVEHIKDPKVQEFVAKVRDTQTAEEVYRISAPLLVRLRELGYFLSPDEQDQPEEPQQEESQPDEQQPQVQHGPDQDEAGSRGDSADDADESEDDTDASDAGHEEVDGEDGAGAGEGSGEADEEERPGAGEADAGDEDAGEAADEAAPGADGGMESGGESEQEPGEQAAQDADPGNGADADADGELGADGQEAGSPESGDAPGGSGDGQREEDAGADPAGEGSPEGASEGEASDAEPDGGLNDGADQDDVPEDDAGSGAGSDGARPAGPGTSDEQGDADATVAGDARADADQPADGPDGAADSTDGDQDGRSDQAEGGTLESPVRDGDPSEGPGGQDPQLDAGPGDRQDGEEPQPSEAAGAGDGQDEPGEGDGSRGEEPQQSADQHDGGDSEVIDSGADEGGIEIDHMPAYGDENDVADVIEALHPHGNEHDSSMEETPQEQAAIIVAVIQGQYFETPSAAVLGVVEHKHSDDDAHGWSNPRAKDDDSKVKFGIICDMEIHETVLGPALLRTRRVFSDNKTTSYQPNLRSGRVNAKVLGRRAWKGDDDRLFGKKRIPGKKDYAVRIMMDISSSNLGMNLALLKRSVGAQAELCHRAGIPFEIVAHSAGGGQFGDLTGYIMHLSHIKSFDEPWTAAVAGRLADLAAIGGNLDGHAMEYGRKTRWPEVTDKIMLYYTDGKMPAANKEEEKVILERQIKLCKRDGILLLGVGIRTDSPKEHGLDTVQVDDDDDLQAVIEHLGKRLTRSAR